MSTSKKYEMKEIQQLGLEVAIAFVKAMAIEEFSSNDVVAVYDGLSESIVSVVMDTQTTEEKMDHVIKAVLEFYKKRDALWSWMVGPLSKPAPSVLAKYLEKHNLFLVEKSPGMYFNLEQKRPEAPIISLDIHEVDANDDLNVWIIPEREAFPKTSDNGEGYRQLNASKPHGPGTSFRHYVGYCNSEPVSAVTLFLHGELAMIHNVATRPLFQRRQFATAMVVRVMQDAKKEGIKHCFLDASEKGKNVYGRIGFEDYCMQWVYKLIYHSPQSHFNNFPSGIS